MATQKKDKVEVRDLKPNKDAKGGKALAVHTPSGNRTPAARTGTTTVK
ncbi:MAG: hypothetical protein ACR2FX_08880 [Chthoniobacterales bacterium]